MVGRTSRIMLAHININITHMTSNQDSMAHHIVCVEDLTIPPSTVIKVNMILSWPENQGILFFYISKTLQMNRISFMAFLLNAVL